MDTESVGLRNDLNVQVITRLRALYTYVYEMAEAFGVDDSALDSIDKGVYQRRIIQKIIIKYKNRENVVLGKVTISINWERHQILAETENGSSFTVNTDRSIHSQITAMSDVIIKHIDLMRKSLPIVKITASYEYLPEINDVWELKEAAMKFLGHHLPSKSDKEEIQKEFTHSIELIAKHLEEVSIVVQNS